MRLAALLVLLALLAHTGADPGGGQIRTLDEGAEPEVRPLQDNVDEFLQLAGEKNNPDQAKLAADAEGAHATKLEMEKTAQSAEAKFKEADTQAQAATKLALETASPDDADAAVTMKQAAATAKESHSKAQTDYSAAQQNADEALKTAQDAGAIVNLPSPPTQPPPQPAPQQAAPAPEALPPVQPPQLGPTKLESVLKERRMNRLKNEAHDLHKKYEEAKVEKEDTDYAFTKAQAALTKVETRMAEAKSARAAAAKEQKDTDKQILSQHVAEHLAQQELKDAKHEAKLSESMVDEAKVEEEVASSLADTGGGLEDLEQSEEKREEVDERLKNAKAEVVALKLASEKAKAAAEAAETALQEKTEKLDELRTVLRKADGRFAESEYEIHHTEHDEIIATEDRDQAKAEDENANKALQVAHGLATAASLKATAAANAEEEQMKALLRDPEEAKKEAIARVKDQDGLSKDGNPLIAEDGSIEQAFIQKYNEMPLPDNGNNPILEAEARAQIKDDQEREATAVASAPGVAETAAAASTSMAAPATPA